jgi:hypothetical protein
MMTRTYGRASLQLTACAIGFLSFGSPCLAQGQSQSPGTDPYKAVIVTVPSPTWGYSYAPYAVVRTPLDGVAEVMRAEGDYLKKRQEANLLRLQVREKRLEVRRKELEHWKWEREFRQQAILDEQENYRKAQVEINRRFPPVAEIITAGPLNSLYDELQGRPDLPAAGSTAVDAAWLAHIHVTVSGRANIGLLKDEKIIWPELLLRADFADEQETIEKLLARAKELVMSGSADQKAMAPLLRDLDAAVQACEERINASVNDAAHNPRHYIEGKRFLNQVVDARFMLANPDAASFLTPLQGKTVAELVAHMKRKGLHFAPATVGCEGSYVALHRALADEVTRLKNLETPSNNR